VALRAVRGPLLIEPGPLFVLPAGHELEVIRVDTAGQPAGVVWLVQGRDSPAIVDLPHDLVTAADLLSHPYESVAVLISGSLPAPAAGRCLDAVADEFLPEGHRWECKA
jgi:hypothetical protein